MPALHFRASVFLRVSQRALRRRTDRSRLQAQEGEVEEALQAFKAYATNRLPALDGFVNANASTIAKLENPHYQLRIDIESQGPNQTLVSVTAKITAWNAEEDPSRSHYVVIPSNGRLEQDMLDRLSVLLEKGRIDDSMAVPHHSRSAASAADSPARPPHRRLVDTRPLSSAFTIARACPPGRSRGDPTAPVPPSGSVSRVNSADPASLASEIDSDPAQLQATEMNQRKLQQQVSELQANASSQKVLSNLAVIKTPQAPVFQQDDDTSKVLFRADPEDEFEVINVKGNWFHVRLENGAEGWIRGAQLQPPQEVDDTEDAAAAHQLLNAEPGNQAIRRRVDAAKGKAVAVRLRSA